MNVLSMGVGALLAVSSAVNADVISYNVNIDGEDLPNAYYVADRINFGDVIEVGPSTCYWVDEVRPYFYSLNDLSSLVATQAAGKVFLTTVACE